LPLPQKWDCPLQVEFAGHLGVSAANRGEDVTGRFLDVLRRGLAVRLREREEREWVSPEVRFDLGRDPAPPPCRGPVMSSNSQLDR